MAAGRRGGRCGNGRGRARPRWRWPIVCQLHRPIDRTRTARLDSVVSHPRSGATHAQRPPARRRGPVRDGTRPAGRGAGKKVVLGMSGWTGFAPLSLAEEAGIFKKNGVDVSLVIPPVQRSAALAAGRSTARRPRWTSTSSGTPAGIPTVQVLLIDKSNGGDGIAVRGNIASIKELKGKTVAVDGARDGAALHAVLHPGEERALDPRRDPPDDGRAAGRAVVRRPGRTTRR